MQKVPKQQGPMTYGWLFILAICALMLFFWLLMHRVIPDDPGNSHSLEDKLRSKRHIQSLIDETHKLLREVVASNVSVSKQTLLDLHALTVDTNTVNKDLKELNSQLTRLEDGYTLCMKEKYDLGTVLQICKNSQRAVEPPKALAAPCPTISTAATAPTFTGPSITEKWLVIGIPTVSRTNDEEYLLQSLDTLAEQLPSDPSDLMYDQILVNVVNLQVNAHPEKEHTVYNKAKQKYAAGHPKSRYFSFTEIIKEEILPDTKPGSNAQNDMGNANRPGFLVRRQTRNIVTVMRRNLHKARHYLFLEDDMQFCPNGLLAMQYMLNKATRYHPDWLAVRASYGMNGIFMHDKDLAVFADYLLKHQARRPPDHLVVEWYAGETPESAAHKQRRANIGFRYNLFNHIGLVSTLRSQKQTTFPKCYELLAEPTVFKVEAFSPKECPKDDIWPCNVKHPDKHRIDWAHQ
jgi:hypothetical protein